MFGKKAKELEAVQQLLTARNSENELMKKRIAELEDEVKRLKEQEDLVLRALTEANKTAVRIEEEANQKRDELLEEANEKVRTAEEKANEVLAEADELAEMTKQDADKYSENIRTDANIFVERTIFESQSEIKKRKDVVNDLNELLKKTTKYLEEQTAAFNSMLSSVIEESGEAAEELTKGLDACSCNCEECADPCAMAKKKKAEDDEDEDEECEDGASEENAEAEPEAEPEPEPEPETHEDAACADEENAPADEEVDTSKLPEEYDDPAVLMHNIYYLQKRDIPKTEKVFSDPFPKGGLTFEDEIGEGTPLTVLSDEPGEDALEDAAADVIEAS
jgi:hypothetical protein